MYILLCFWYILDYLLSIFVLALLLSLLILFSSFLYMFFLSFWVCDRSWLPALALLLALLLILLISLVLLLLLLCPTLLPPSYEAVLSSKYRWAVYFLVAGALGTCREWAFVTLYLLFVAGLDSLVMVNLFLLLIQLCDMLLLCISISMISSSLALFALCCLYLCLLLMLMFLLIFANSSLISSTLCSSSLYIFISNYYE